MSLKKEVRKYENKLIFQKMKESKNKTDAAKKLGITRTALIMKLRAMKVVWNFCECDECQKKNDVLINKNT